MFRHADLQLSNIALSPHTTVGGHVHTVTINTDTPFTDIEAGQRPHVDTIVDFCVYDNDNISMASRLPEGEANLSNLTQREDDLQCLSAQLADALQIQANLMETIRTLQHHSPVLLQQSQRPTYQQGTANSLLDVPSLHHDPSFMVVAGTAVAEDFLDIKDQYLSQYSANSLHTMMLSKLETDMKDIKKVNPTTLRAHNTAFRLYSSRRGKRKYIYTFSQYDQARLAICQQVSMSFDELKQIPEDDLMILLEAAYPFTTDTILIQLKKAIAKHPPSAVIVSINEVFDAHTIWLEILREIPSVLTMLGKDQARFYAMLFPLNVQHQVLDKHGIQRSVSEMWLKAQEVGQQCVDYYHMKLQEKPVAGSKQESWRLQKNHEAGSYKANLAATFPPFVPSYGACFHCNQKGHKVNDSACTNTADPSTHCGPCGNEEHPCLGGKCPKRDVLMASRSSRQASMAELVSTIAALRAQIADKVRRSLIANAVSDIPVASSDVIHVDSGSNAIFLNSCLHSDSIVTPVVGPQEVASANGTISPIVGTGSILGREAMIAPTFTDNLIGVSNFCASTAESPANVAIFDSEGMLGVVMTDEIRNLLILLEKCAVDNNLIKLKAIQHNGLYSTTVSDLKHIYSGDTLHANANYYQTVKTNGPGELVRFYHECWSHANEQQMVAIVKHQMFTSIPPELTVKAIHKYFPTCVPCVKGNLVARPFPSEPVDREVLVGEEWVIDIKMWTEKSFSGGNMSCTATDAKSRFMHGFWITGKKKVLDKMKEIRSMVVRKGLVLKTFRVDNEFVTTDIEAWCARPEIDIHLKPCVPYCHDTTSIVEKDHQSLQNRVVTALDQEHLSSKYVAYAYYDVLDKLNMMPHSLNGDTSSQIMWDGSKIDLKNQPILPFGCLVMSRIPLELQTALGGRSVVTFNVGRAKGYKGGVQLFNPETKRMVIRRDFKVMGATPVISSIYNAQILYEAIDDVVDDHPSFYGADMGPPEFVCPVVTVHSAEPVASMISDDVVDISRDLERIEDSRDLTTGESVLLIQSVLPIELPSHSSVDTQISHSSISTDVMPVDVSFATVPRVVEVLPGLSPEYELVKIKRILNHTGLPQKSSKLYFNVEWESGDITWKKYSSVKGSEALDAYIILNPALAILSSSVPAAATREFIPHRYGTRDQLKHRYEARMTALKTGVYEQPDRDTSWGKQYPLNTSCPVPAPLEQKVSCDLPHPSSAPRKSPSRRTMKRAARYGTQSVFKERYISPPPIPSRRALIAAQILDEQTRPSRRALVAAQLLEDEATYDPLLLQNIEAGEYSEELLEKGMILLTEIDDRAGVGKTLLTAALGKVDISTSHSSSPLPPVPLSVSQALDSLEWESWMNVTSVELESLKKMSVWHTPLIPFKDIPKQKIIPSKVIFARKYNADGTFQKYKARLCARGDRWQEALGVETYAGTVKSESIKMLLGIAAEENYEICCVDVETAFLHSPLPPDQTIYMRRPVGLTDLHMPEIVELDKCLYGLPQASNRFREHSDTVLRGIGFTPTISDPCVYVMHRDGGKVYALIHVDDIGLIGSTVDLLTQVKVGLSKTYTLKETDMSNYLGMHIVRDRPNRTITLHQTGYIMSLMVKFAPEMAEFPSNPTTPMLTVTGTCTIVSPFLGKRDITEYQGIVGSLMYLASQTRPDILYAVCAHARFAKSPTESDREGAIRILHYVKNTPDLGLKLYSGEGIVLYATVDASYACHTDLKSHTGCTLHLGRASGSIFSLSKKQTVTADSSTVAELIAAHLAAHEIMWARNFLQELGYPQQNPTTLFEDNMSTISLILNKGNGQRSKHIDLRYNFVREQVVNKILAMVHLPGVDMTSDILTKPLGPTAFLHLRPKLLGMAAVMSLKQLKRLEKQCSSMQS
jgi:hypothetical protein